MSLPTQLQSYLLPVTLHSKPLTISHFSYNQILQSPLSSSLLSHLISSLLYSRGHAANLQFAQLFFAAFESQVSSRGASLSLPFLFSLPLPRQEESLPWRDWTGQNMPDGRFCKCGGKIERIQMNLDNWHWREEKVGKDGMRGVRYSARGSTDRCHCTITSGHDG